MSIYVDLTHEFNVSELNAILSSGQAVVLHRLAAIEQRWRLDSSRERRCLEPHAFRTCRTESRVPLWRALDLRWMRGGWSAHLEFRDGPLRIRTDFVTRPPRLTAEAIDELWRRQEGCEVPFVDARNLIELKKTNREKDYAVIGELARLLTNPERTASDGTQCPRHFGYGCTISRIGCFARREAAGVGSRRGRDRRP